MWTRAWMPMVAVLVVAAALVRAQAAGGSPTLPTPTTECSREKSRWAREILEDTLYPFAESLEFKLPENCPFVRERDRFREDEENKQTLRMGQWKCTRCGKVFMNERYLDKHIDKRHPLTVEENSVCLGDYCDILNCEKNSELAVAAAASALAEANAGVGGGAGGMGQGDDVCRERAMEKKRFMCEVVMHTCLPAEHSAEASQLLEYFTTKYCAPLTCNRVVLEKLRLKEEAESRAASAATSTLHIIVAGALLGIAALFYVGVWVYRRDTAVQSDLRRLSRSRHSTLLSALKRGKQKGT